MKILQLFALALVTTTLGFGQAKPSRISDSAAGFSFEPIAGWTGDRGTDGYSLINPEKTILVAVKPHGYDSFEAAVRDAKFDGDTQVVGEPRDLANGGKFVRLAKQTTQGRAIVDIFVLFSPNGGGVTVIGLTDDKNAEASFYAASAVAQSIAFTKPTAGTSSSPWQAALSGKHLLYLYSGNGYFEEKHIYLCASGAFLQRTGEGGFSPGDVDGPSFSARGGRRGSWSITGNALVLRFQDGSIGQFTLSRRQASNEVGLNGNRYFVQTQSVCQ